jgi:sugar fermentation stimulation protein A
VFTIHTYPALIPGVLIRRYKRFLADVRFRNGRTVIAFCPNSGSMLGLTEPGTPVMLSRTKNPLRKTRHTLEMLKPREVWIAVNTHLTNDLAESLIRANMLSPALSDIDSIRREVTVGASRLDFLLTQKGKPVYVEVKSVTLQVGDSAQFPDAVTERGRRHLETLMALRSQGKKTCMLYLVQRGDCTCFAPARHIDPRYAETLVRALREGVKLYAYRLSVSPEEGVLFSGAMPLCRDFSSRH